MKINRVIILFLLVLTFIGCGSSSKTDPIVVYFEKPGNWSDVSIYYYDTNSGIDVIWDKSPEMEI